MRYVFVDNYIVFVHYPPWMNRINPKASKFAAVQQSLFDTLDKKAPMGELGFSKVECVVGNGSVTDLQAERGQAGAPEPVRLRDKSMHGMLG